MTWQTCLRFVTRRRPLVLATAPDRAEASRQGGPMHDRTCLEVLQLLLCKFTTRARLPLDSFVPRESTVRNDIIALYEFRRRRPAAASAAPARGPRPTGRAAVIEVPIGKQEMAAASSGAPKYRVIYNWDGAPHGYGAPPQSMESFLDATFAPLTNTHCDGARRPSPHEVCFTAAGLCRSPPPRNPTTPTHTLARTRTRSRVALAAGR